MSETEIGLLLQELMKKYKNAIKSMEESAEFQALQKRMEELEKLDEKDEMTEETIREAESIQKKFDELEKMILDLVMNDLTQNQIKEILFAISPQFIEENHIQTSFFAGPFEEIVRELLKRLEDEDCKLHNELLANNDFVDVFLYATYIIKQLIEHTNSEEIIMEFITKYRQNCGKQDPDSLVMPDNELGPIIEAIMNTENYSATFKESLLSDPEILSDLTSIYLLNIIKLINTSKEQKLAFLLRPDILDKMNPYAFSTALASLCESFEDFQQFINDERIFPKIKIDTLIKNAKLSTSELKQLLLDDKVIKNISSLDLTSILEQTPMDFETRKSLIFDERIFPKLQEHGVYLARLICSKYINGEQRMELLSDSRICDVILPNDSLINNLDIILKSKNLSVQEKITIMRDSRFSPFITDGRLVEEIIRDPDLPIETANEILFDKRFFYKLIGEWNEEYNNRDYLEQGPFKYDKYEYLKKLFEKNPYIAKTFTFGLFKDEILDFGFDFIEKMSRYPHIASQLVNRFNFSHENIYLKNMIMTIEQSQYADKIDTTLFVTRLIDISGDSSFYSNDPAKVRKLATIRHTAKLNPETITEEQWKTITEIGLRDLSIYYENVEASWFGPIRTEIDCRLNLLPDVETIEDLDHYTERRMQLCDEVFKSAIEKHDLEEAKNAYFNKYFSINIQEAKEIVRLFGKSIRRFANNPDYTMQTKYIEQIINILNIEKIETIEQNYFDSRLQPIYFDEMIYIDQSLRQMYCKEMSDSVYKVTDQIVDENGSKVPNTPKEMEFTVEINGQKTRKKVLVYEPGFDFKMLIHSTAAYGEMQLINDNYFDSWNKSERKTNHGICCSLIANDNMGMAEVHDVLFGFDSWDPKAITKSAPYDIYSSNDDYDIQEGRPIQFMTAQDIINHTRHSHNEHVLERFELREDRRTTKCQNIQPSYVIIYSDMPDEIKQKAIKCSEEMNIPIVYIDKEKIVKHEVEKIDTIIAKIYSSTSIEEKLDLFEQVLLSHENNRSGFRITNPDWLEQYFPTKRIEDLIEHIISDIQNNYQATDNIMDYYQYGSHFMEILDKENQKFIVTMETTERKNYIDIPIDQYETRIMQFINSNLCKNNTPKMEKMIEIFKEKKTDLPFAQILLSIDPSFIHKHIGELIENGLYKMDEKNHNIGHIERVLLLSQMIGKKELLLENGEIDSHALDLLVQCAKYHDCGRKNDFVDKRHAEASAKIMEPFLVQDGYSEEDIKIMQIIVEYHEKSDDDLIFEKLCKKYGLDSSKIEYVKKIANCLKDADALDRTRFKNSHARLEPSQLRFEESKSLVLISEQLIRCYEEYDKRQFKLFCELLQRQKEMAEMFDRGVIEEGGVKSATI